MALKPGDHACYWNGRTSQTLRRLGALALGSATALALIAGTTAQAQTAPTVATAATDWTSVGSNIAQGNLLGTGVRLRGTHVWDTPVSRVDESWTAFAGPASTFSPSLPATDEIQVSGTSSAEYEIQFLAPVTDPILEIGSLASKLTFTDLSGTLPSPIAVTRLSGESQSGVRNFTVSGSSVSGTLNTGIGTSGNSDASGTIKLTGTFTTVKFTATKLYSAPAEDGIILQLVTQPRFTDWTSVGSNIAQGNLLGTGVRLRGTHVWDTPVSRVDESWTAFAGPASTFSPSLPATDEIQVSGTSSAEYEIQFLAPVTDPILEIGSLASKLTFTDLSGTLPSPIAVTRLSGESQSGVRNFTVSGSSVSGTLNTGIGTSGNSDASGTIKLTGTFTTVKFTATKLYSAPAEDGIILQLGSAPH
jgi:hypothetical protein